MRLEHQSVEDLKKNILFIFGEHLDLKKYKVFFFGSRVSGKNRESSDIDVGVEGPTISRIVLSQIKEEIENLPTLYTIEVVDFNNVSVKFKEVANQYVESLN